MLAIAAAAAAAIHWGSLVPLLVTGLATMGSPGPATISVTAAGAAYGVRNSLGYAAGITGRTWVVLVAVATGITVTLLAVPALRIVVIVFSAAYILRLAYHVATAPPLREADAGEHAPSFVGGAVLAVVNPKAWVAIAATFASARLADAPAADALVKVTILGGLLIVIMGGWLVTGASIAPLLRDPRRSRRFNLALAIALVVATALAVIH